MLRVANVGHKGIQFSTDTGENKMMVRDHRDSFRTFLWCLWLYLYITHPAAHVLTCLHPSLQEYVYSHVPRPHMYALSSIHFNDPLLAVQVRQVMPGV